MRATARVLFSLIFLCTPLRSVAAAALCVVGSHGASMQCDGEMAGMAKGSSVAAHAQSGALPDQSARACGDEGLCASAPPSLSATSAALPLLVLADADPLSALPQFGPGIRPAPPIHPPKA